MAFFEAIKTNLGFAVLANAEATDTPIQVSYYKIGSTANIPPDPAAVDVNTPVYTGPAEHISFRLPEPNKAIIRVTLPESVGNFVIGNIGLFTADDEMVVHGTFESTIQKVQTNGTSPGNRHVISIPIVYADIGDLINFVILNSFDASLPWVDTESDLPTAILSEFEAYVVRDYSVTGGPALAIRRSIGGSWSWYLSRMYDNLQNPYRGMIDGGVYGDGRAFSEDGSYWGGYFLDDLGSPDRSIDGGEFTSSLVTSVDFGSFA